MSEISERVAVLETKVAHLEETLERFGHNQEEIIKKQQEMLLALTKYRGMWGGIALLVGGVWAFVSTFGKDIASFFHR